jgi:glutamate dehydrogenase/leucine dehydrogenase
MTPDNHNQVLLDELNKIIADEKGVRVEDLAITDGKRQSSTKSSRPKEEIITTEEVVVPVVPAATESSVVTSSDLRSMADKLFKEAQALRRKADEIDPPKAKSKTVKADA